MALRLPIGPFQLYGGAHRLPVVFREHRVRLLLTYEGEAGTLAFSLETGLIFDSLIALPLERG